MPNATCTIDDCDKPARTRGMCNTHYWHWWKNADPSELKYRRGQPKPPCSIEGCERPAKCRGWCGTHYTHWRQYGTPEAKVYTGRTLNASGYVRVWAPGHPMANSDNYVLEHRMVVHDAGIDVPPGHHVHHINGDKADNRLENLEVLSESERHRLHIAETGTVVNQFGEWDLRKP